MASIAAQRQPQSIGVSPEFTSCVIFATSTDQLPLEIHRRDVDFLRARLGIREGREGAGATEDFERLAIEHPIAGRFRHRALDHIARAVNHELLHLKVALPVPGPGSIQRMVPRPTLFRSARDPVRLVENLTVDTLVALPE